MSRQNPFMRSTGYRFCNNCQNGCQNKDLPETPAHKDLRGFLEVF